jgi:hypothetical protein
MPKLFEESVKFTVECTVQHLIVPDWLRLKQLVPMLFDPAAELSCILVLSVNSDCS